MSRIVYLDESCKVHASYQKDLTPIEVDMLDGFCDAYVEGLMIVPEGQTAQHPDGRLLTGFTVAPWKNSAELDNAQREYEKQLIADMENALAILLGGDVT